MEPEEKIEKGVLNPVAQCHLSLKSACILEWHVNEYLFSLGLEIDSTTMKLKLYVPFELPSFTHVFNDKTLLCMTAYCFS